MMSYALVDVIGKIKEMSKIKPDDIYESGGIIIECMEEDVEDGIKQLHAAIKLQKSVKKWEHDLVTAPLDEQPVHWLDHEISDYLSQLIKESEKN